MPFFYLIVEIKEIVDLGLFARYLNQCRHHLEQVLENLIGWAYLLFGPLSETRQRLVNLP